jgi:hypothetical protein
MRKESETPTQTAPREGHTRRPRTTRVSRSLPQILGCIATQAQLSCWPRPPLVASAGLWASALHTARHTRKRKPGKSTPSHTPCHRLVCMLEPSLRACPLPWRAFSARFLLPPPTSWSHDRASSAAFACAAVLPLALSVGSSALTRAGRWRRGRPQRQRPWWWWRRRCAQCASRRW